MLRLTEWLWGEHVVPPGHRLTAWVFLRLLAMIYLVAFVSMWVQVQGLVGPSGILPAHDILTALRARYGPTALWIAPTLGWLGSGAGALHAMCAAGVVLAIALLVGLAPILTLAGAWFLYLSLTILGQSFFWFQWDSLLLETGLLALLIAPWRRWSRPDTDPAPRGAGIWLFRWLLFRLTFSSAAVKLLSGDPFWRGLTALQFHFETQPLPPWTAWFAHHMPAGFLRASTVSTLIVEGIVPFLLFAPRRVRHVAVLLLAMLQILILISGNYGFFNWLTLALCVVCLDDGVWPGSWRERVAPGGAPGGRWFGWALGPLAALFFIFTLVPFLTTLRVPTSWLGPVEYASDLAWPIRSFNRYGLFAVMTPRRVEIVVEGSAEGLSWLPYEFRWKPGDPLRRPDFVAPHQPRLDWQMWFAALSDFRNQPWFLMLVRRMLEGSKPVGALFEKDPFPRGPPKYIRALAYEYHFTSPDERRRTKGWWRRQLLGLYCPVLTLENGQLVAVGAPETPPEARRP